MKKSYQAKLFCSIMFEQPIQLFWVKLKPWVKVKWNWNVDTTLVYINGVSSDFLQVDGVILTGCMSDAYLPFSTL